MMKTVPSRLNLRIPEYFDNRSWGTIPMVADWPRIIPERYDFAQLYEQYVVFSDGSSPLAVTGISWFLRKDVPDPFFWDSMEFNEEWVEELRRIVGTGK